MHRFEESLLKSRAADGFASGYIAYFSELLTQVDIATFAHVADVLARARDRRQKIFICGNGGSAATASHIAEDLALAPQKSGILAFRTISLTDNTASITAIANDEGYDTIFIRQLENLFEKGDVVIGISASGNSSNVIKALEYANNNDGISVSLTGFDGGKMKKISQYGLHIATSPGEYEVVEDAHLIIGHMLASYFKYQPCK